MYFCAWVIHCGNQSCPSNVVSRLISLDNLLFLLLSLGTLSVASVSKIDHVHYFFQGFIPRKCEREINIASKLVPFWYHCFLCNYSTSNIKEKGMSLLNSPSPSGNGPCQLLCSYNIYYKYFLLFYLCSCKDFNIYWVLILVNWQLDILWYLQKNFTYVNTLKVKIC